jgi:hypothetical protein
MFIIYSDFMYMGTEYVYCVCMLLCCSPVKGDIICSICLLRSADVSGLCMYSLEACEAT